MPRDLVPGGGRDVAAGPAVEAGQWTLKAEEAEKKVRPKPVALVQGNILKTRKGIVTENVVEQFV